MSTKKVLKTPAAADSEINTNRNDWLVDVNQATCNHSLSHTSQFKEYDDGWQYARCMCQICGLSWDAWSAPGAQTIPRAAWLALVNGAPLSAKESGDDYALS
jgi:hypothetical protein